MADDAPKVGPDEIAMLDKSGAVRIGPKALLDVGLQAGFVPATPEALKEAALKKQYGEGPLNAVKAFAAGAASAGSFGLSDVFLTKSGMTTPEALGAFERYNPTAYPLGQAAGVLGGLALAPEAEGVAGLEAALKTAKASHDVAAIAEAGRALDTAKASLSAKDLLSPVGAVSKIGAKASGLLPEAGPGLAGKIAGLGAKGLGSAVEGSFYGLGQTVHEAALGDPDAVSERLLANVGMGALLGGGLGSAVEAGRLVIPKSVDLAQNAVGKAWRTLWGDAKEVSAEPLFGHPEGEFPKLTDTAEVDLPKPGLIPSLMAKANEAITGTPQAETLNKIAARKGMGELLSKQELTSYQKQLTESLQSTLDGVGKAFGDAYNKAKPEEIEKLLEGQGGAQALSRVTELNQSLTGAIERAKNQPESFMSYLPKKLEAIQDGLNAGLHEESSAAEVFKELDRAKQLVDDISGFKARLGDMPIPQRESLLLARSIGKELRQTLQDPELWGPLAARQEALNNVYSSFKNLSGEKSLIRQGFMKNVQTPAGPKWVVNQNKVNQYLNNIHRPEGLEKTQALREFFGAARDSVSEIQNTFKNAPSQNLDAKAYQSLVDKQAKLAEEAHGALANQGPGMGYGGLSNLLTLGLATHLGGPAGAAFALAKGLGHGALDPEVMALKLANIEKAASKTARLIRAGTKAIVDGSAASLGALKGPIIQDLNQHEEKAEKLRRLHADPMHMIDHMTAMTNPVYEVAPQTAQSLNEAGMRGVSFLATKLPVSEPTGFFEKKRPMAEATLATYQKYERVVERPLTVLEDMRQNRLSNEGLEALQAVYPKLYQDMQMGLMDHLTKLKDRSKIPYSTRITLSQFMGQPLAESLSPAYLQTAHQASMAAASEQAPKPAEPMQHLTLGERTGTEFTNSLRRKT